MENPVVKQKVKDDMGVRLQSMKWVDKLKEAKDQSLYVAQDTGFLKEEVDTGTSYQTRTRVKDSGGGSIELVTELS